MNKKAVHFGAGNIGRGFLGQLYFESGFSTTFVDVVDAVVTELQRRKTYPIRIVEEVTESVIVEHVTAVNGKDLEAVGQALAEADIASTAVGVNVLPHIAPAIARGVEKRFASPNTAPLNFIVCENLIHAGPFLREKVKEHLNPALHARFDEETGFVEASIGRMVPVMTEAQKAEDPLLVCVEPYCELPVDALGFKGAVPEIAHMKPMPNFGAYVERKLFVHNLSHATTAYLGYLRGHEFIWQAIRDGAVRTEVEAATAESCRALAAKHGLALADLDAHRADLIRRYHNRALGDQVARVARDPLRKLSPNDRLIGSAAMCLAQGILPEHVTFAVAAAIRYDHPDDPAAQSLQHIRRERGMDGVLSEVCQLAPGDPLARLVKEAAERLEQQWKA